jgi:peroxiredoxin
MKYLILIAFLYFVSIGGSAQNEAIIPVQVKEKFSDFTLNDHNGNTVSLPDLKGKKVMLVFIRGKVTPQIWCPICHYQYLEAMQAQVEQNLSEELNMEIFFVLPYSMDSLENWKNAFAGSISTIEKWKNPEKDENTPQGVIDWAEYSSLFFPYTFKVPDNVELNIPVLMDENLELSKGLFLFKEEWGGTKVAQNVPTIFIIDEEGYVQFKYHSQYTNDRPDMRYITEYVKKMM